MHEIRKITDEYIYIIDSNQGKSITNDAENIIELIDAAVGIDGRKIYYKDTMGIIDQILTENGKFNGFKSGKNDPIVNDLKQI